MERRRKMRTWQLLAACLLGLSFLTPVCADTSPPNASSATATASPSASSTKASQATNLGKINVTATRELIKTLQVVKVALNEPYSSSRDKANVVVCRIITGHGHMSVQERMGAVLECGTNSWFTWKRETCQNGGLAACAHNGPLTSAFKRKGAWHSMRALNLQQLMALRKLLKELPAPGKGDIVVVDKNGKAVMAIKASDSTPGPD